MKHVGVRELRNRVTSLLREEEPMVIQRHGHEVGIYIPLGELDAVPLELRLHAFHRITDDIARSSRRTEVEVVRRFKSLRRLGRPPRGKA